MPIPKGKFNVYRALERRLQNDLNTLAERPDMTPDNPEYIKAVERVQKIGRVIDEHLAENREVDKEGKLVAPPVTRLPAIIDHAAEASRAAKPTQQRTDNSVFNYHFEPSVSEAREALRNNPQLLKQLGESDWTGVASPERVEVVSDPMTGIPQGSNVVPAQTHLDQLTEDDSAYKRYTDYVWEQRSNEAKARGQSIQRYRDVPLEKPVDFLAGGLEYNIDRRLAPAALGVADAFSMGQATPLYDAARDLAEYELSQPDPNDGQVEDVLDPMTGSKVGENIHQGRSAAADQLPPSSQEVIGHSPASYVVGNIAGYGAPGNLTNVAANMALKGANYASRGLSRPAVSAVVGAVGNTVEGAVQDFGTALGEGQDVGQAASRAASNAPLNFAVGGVAGGALDAVANVAGWVRNDVFRGPDRIKKPLALLEAAGGGTHPLTGIQAPPEILGHVRDAGRRGAVGSAGDRAAAAVAPDIERHLNEQSVAQQEAIGNQMQEYYEHPAYGSRTTAFRPVLETLVDMARQGRFAAPLSGAPRNLDPKITKAIGSELRNYTEYQIVPRGAAEDVAKRLDGVVVEPALAQELFQIPGQDMPVGGDYEFVIVGPPMNAKTLTDLEERIYREIDFGKAKSTQEDPVFAGFNKAVKTMRDQFPYYVDDAGNLIPPPDWVDPNAASSSPNGPGSGPVYDGEFEPTPRPTDPGTDIEGPFPPTEPSPGGRPPPSGDPQLPEGGGPAPSPGTLRSVAPEEATPLSLLAGNKLAMPRHDDYHRPARRQTPEQANDPGQSLPAPSPREWTEATDESAQWFDEIVSPGAPARSGEAKRMADLTEQQRAMDEAQAEIRKTEERLGPLPDDAREQSLIKLIGQKLGREVTREDLVRAGLLAGSVAAIGAGEEESGAAGAAVTGLSLFNPRDLGRHSQNFLGRINKQMLVRLAEEPKALDEYLTQLRSMRSIPDADKELISATLREWHTTARQELGLETAPRRPEREPYLDEIGTPLGRKGESELPIVPSNEPKNRTRDVFEAGGHYVNRGVDEAVKRVLGKDTDVETLAKAWNLDSLTSIASDRVNSTIGKYGQNGLVWRASGFDGKSKEPAWMLERVLRREDGQLIAKHEYFKIREDLQGAEQGAKVIREQMDAYRKLGVDRVAIDHAVLVGRYYWPSLGFDNQAAVPSAVRAYKKFLVNEHGMSPEAAEKAARGIKSLPSLANAEHGKEFFLSNDYEGAWSHDLTMDVSDANPRWQFLKKRLDIMIASGLALDAVIGEDEDPGSAQLLAAAAIGGSGGGRRSKRGKARSAPPGGAHNMMPPSSGGPPTTKPMRQLEAELDDGTKVRGFSALRRKQHLAQEGLERAKKRVGAGGDETIENRVRTWNQNSGRKNVDETLLQIARDIGKERELRSAAATNIYGDLRAMASSPLGGNDGFLKGSADWFGLRIDPLLESLSGAERNPFARSPTSTLGSIQRHVLADPARRLLNMSGGRPGARHGEHFRDLWRETTKDERDNEERENEVR